MSNGSTELAWWERGLATIGCGAGAVTIGVTGAVTVPACAATVGAGCVVGAAALAYEIDQTQASCRAALTGQQTSSLGNQMLGGGWLGLGYDLAGLAGAVKNGAVKIGSLIGKARAANSLGDAAAIARDGGKLPEFLKGLTSEELADLVNKGKVSVQELKDADISIPAGVQGGNISKATAPSPESPINKDVPLSDVKNSQADVSSTMSDGTKISDAASDMKANGWDHSQPNPDMVQWEDGSYQTLDHRRLEAARQAGLSDVPATVHHPDELLPDPERFRNNSSNVIIDEEAGRVYYPGDSPSTWGEAARMRASNQRSSVPDFPLRGTNNPPDVKFPGGTRVPGTSANSSMPSPPPKNYSPSFDPSRPFTRNNSQPDNNKE